jgi:hypothetical protein
MRVKFVKAFEDLAAAVGRRLEPAAQQIPQALAGQLLAAEQFVNIIRNRDTAIAHVPTMPARVRSGNPATAVGHPPAAE